MKTFFSVAAAVALMTMSVPAFAHDGGEFHGKAQINNTAYTSADAGGSEFYRQADAERSGGEFHRWADAERSGGEFHRAA
jgi:hypothetical protein